jgi:hypothetical protein
MRWYDESPVLDTTNPHGVNCHEATRFYIDGTLWDLTHNIFKPSNIEDNILIEFSKV